jgi:hypothetical protein
MIFIRPTILRNKVQTALVTNAKYNNIREVQQQGRGGKGGRVAIMPFENRPLLPELEPAPADAIDLRELKDEPETQEDVQLDVSQ